MGLFDYGGDIYRGFTQREEFHRQNRRQVAADFEEWKRNNPNASADDIRAYIDSAGGSGRYSAAYPNAAAIDRLGAEGERRQQQMLMDQRFQNMRNEVELGNNLTNIIDSMVMQEDDDDVIVNNIVNRMSGGDPALADEIRLKVPTGLVAQRRKAKQQEFARNNYKQILDFYTNTPDGDITELMGDMPKSFLAPIQDRAKTEAEKIRQRDETQRMENLRAGLVNDAGFMNQISKMTSPNDQIAAISGRSQEYGSLDPSRLNDLLNSISGQVDLTRNQNKIAATSRVNDYMRNHPELILQAQNGGVDAQAVKRSVKSVIQQLDAEGYYTDDEIDQMVSAQMNLLDANQLNTYRSNVSQQLTAARTAALEAVDERRTDIKNLIEADTDNIPDNVAAGIASASNRMYISSSDLTKITELSASGRYDGMSNAATAEAIINDAKAIGLQTTDEFVNRFANNSVGSVYGVFQPEDFNVVRQSYEQDINDSQVKVRDAESAMMRYQNSLETGNTAQAQIELKELQMIRDELARGVEGVRNEISARKANPSWVLNSQDRAAALSELDIISRQISGSLSPVINRIDQVLSTTQQPANKGEKTIEQLNYEGQQAAKAAPLHNKGMEKAAEDIANKYLALKYLPKDKRDRAMAADIAQAFEDYPNTTMTEEDVKRIIWRIETLDFYESNSDPY